MNKKSKKFFKKILTSIVEKSYNCVENILFNINKYYMSYFYLGIKPFIRTSRNSATFARVKNGLCRTYFLITY